MEGLENVESGGGTPGGLPTVLQAPFSVCSSTTFSLEREVTGWPVDARTRPPRLGGCPGRC